MENLYAIRDAFFWWAGVWATVTLGNRAVNKALSRRRRDRSEEREREYAQWKRTFIAFLFDADARSDGAETDQSEETGTDTEAVMEEETPYEQ